MALTKPELACEQVLKSLKISILTFSAQETPFSVYVTIRKKFIPNAPVSLNNSESANLFKPIEVPSEESTILRSQLIDAEEKLKKMISENKDIRENLVEMKKLCNQSESEKNYISNENDKLRRNVEECKLGNKILKDELESIEKDGKAFNKVIKQNDKKLHDLEKAITTLRDNLQKEKSEFSNFKSEVNKEKKEAQTVKRSIS